MGWFLKWVFFNLIVPALIGSAGTIFYQRSNDITPVQRFAATSSGGNTLILGILLGIGVSFLFTADLPGVKAYRESWRRWLALKLRNLSNYLGGEVGT